MKKKIALLLAFIMIVSLCVIRTQESTKVYAKTAQMHIELPDEVKKEQEIVARVVLDSDVNLYSVDAYIAYDAERLEFVPTDETCTGAEGVLELKDVFGEETRQKEYEITFKVLEVGEAYVDLTEVYLIDYEDLDYIEVAPSGRRFAISVNEEVSANSHLRELAVAPGELSTPFAGDLFEYEMYVGEDVDFVGVTAIPACEDSTVESEIPERLVDGDNIIRITVTALSGDKCTYAIHVIRGGNEEAAESTESADDDADVQDASADVRQEIGADVQDISADVQQEDGTEEQDEQ